MLKTKKEALLKGILVKSYTSEIGMKNGICQKKFWINEKWYYSQNKQSAKKIKILF